MTSNNSIENQQNIENLPIQQKVLKTVDRNSLLQEGNNQSFFAPTTDHTAASLTPQDGSQIVLPPSEGSDPLSGIISGMGHTAAGNDGIPGWQDPDTTVGNTSDGSQHLLMSSLDTMNAQSYLSN